MATAVEAAELVETWLPLALALARKYAALYPHMLADLESEAGFGLWKAATWWRHDGGKKFSTYAYDHINGRLWQLICRMRRKHPWEFRRQAALADDRGDPLDPVDQLAGREPDPADVAEAHDQDGLAATLLGELRPRDRAVLEAVLGGATYQAIGDGLGLTRERVRQIIERARKHLKATAERMFPSDAADPAQPA